MIRSADKLGNGLAGACICRRPRRLSQESPWDVRRPQGRDLYVILSLHHPRPLLSISVFSEPFPVGAFTGSLNISCVCLYGDPGLLCSPYLDCFSGKSKLK